MSDATPDRADRLRHPGDVMRDGPSEPTPLPADLPFSVATPDRADLLATDSLGGVGDPLTHDYDATPDRADPE